jgi:hypothetical protein
MKNSICPLQDEISSLYRSCHNRSMNSPESLDELIGISSGRERVREEFTMRPSTTVGYWTKVVPVFLAFLVFFGAGAFAADPDLVTRLGGSTQAVAARGSYAYVNVAGKLVVLDVSDPAHPVKVGETSDLPATPECIKLFGNYAYLPVGPAGLTIVNVLDPANPTVVTTVDTPLNALDVDLQIVVGKTYAYVADGNSIRIIDVTDPALPVAKGVFTPGAQITDVALAPGGIYAYCTGPDALTYIVNVSNPDSPSQTGWMYTPYHPADLAVDASTNRMYLLTENQGLETYDITNPAAPAYKSNCDMDGGRAVAAYGGLAYVAVNSANGPFYGLKVVDVTNPLSTHVEGTLQTRGGSVDIALLGQKVFLADRSTGTRVIDVTAPAAPSESGFYYVSPAFAQDVTYSGHYAFVAGGGAGLRVFDMADPSNPVEAGSFQTAGYLYTVTISGNYAYLAEDDAGLRILDISNPAAPVQTGLLNTDGYVRDVQVLDHFAYLADYSKGLRVVDVSDKSNPVAMGLFSGNVALVTRLAMSTGAGGSYAYINGYDNPYTDTKGMAVVNVAAPGSPAFVRAISVWPAAFADFAVSGARLYAAQSKSNGSGTDYLRVYDLAAPGNPTQTGNLSLTSTPAAIWTDGAKVLMADTSGFHIYDVTNPASPTETGGYTAPAGGLGVAAASPYIFFADAGQGLFIFSLQLTQPSISGIVTCGGSGLQNVVLNGLPGNPATNASGQYTAMVNNGWSGTVTPTLAGYTFSPVSRTYTSVTTNQTTQDYTATPLSPVQLTVKVKGTGSGTVTSTPSGINCSTGSSGTCSNGFPSVINVSLQAATAAGSAFGGWQGDCSGTGACTVAMSAARSVTATFVYSPPVRIDGTLPIAYQTVQAAYDAAQNNAVIQMREGTLNGTFTADRSVKVTVRGGYNETYTSTTAMTVMGSPLLLQGGEVTVENVVVR